MKTGDGRQEYVNVLFKKNGTCFWALASGKDNVCGLRILYDIHPEVVEYMGEISSQLGSV